MGNISALQIDPRRQTVGVTRLTTEHAMLFCQPVAQSPGPRIVAKRTLIVLGLFVIITLTVWMQRTWRHVLLTSTLQASQLAQTFNAHSGKLHGIFKFIFK
jgi:hypothetical protein